MLSQNLRAGGGAQKNQGKLQSEYSFSTAGFDDGSLEFDVQRLISYL